MPETLSPRPEPPVVNRPIRILLVDDHEDTLEAMSRLLTLTGHEVVTASTYNEALTIGQQEKFNLLISDIGLVGGSGYDLMRALKSLSPVKGIALSGYGMRGDIDRSKAAGFSTHLTKPCDLSALNAAIEQVLSS